jgi:acyl dehydratase
MTLHYETLKKWKIKDIERTYTAKDTILYALGVGIGQNPLDESQLQFILEDRLRALPAMSVVLAYPPLWYWEAGTTVDPVKVVHAEQGYVMHRPLPISGTVIGQTKITDVIDKGISVGALLRSENQLIDKKDQSLICTVTSASMARGDGGCGGDSDNQKEYEFPSGLPDAQISISTLPQAALLYRLSGDFNPLHADPKHALKAGFSRPILHGRMSFGLANWALIQAFCPTQPELLIEMSARFAKPVIPGETLLTKMWRKDKKIWFCSEIVASNKSVLTRGEALLA